MVIRFGFNVPDSNWYGRPKKYKTGRPNLGTKGQIYLPISSCLWISPYCIFSAFQLSIYLAFLSIFRPSGFLFIRPSWFMIHRVNITQVHFIALWLNSALWFWPSGQNFWPSGLGRMDPTHPTCWDRTRFFGSKSSFSTSRPLLQTIKVWGFVTTGKSTFLKNCANARRIWKKADTLLGRIVNVTEKRWPKETL